MPRILIPLVSILLTINVSAQDPLAIREKIIPLRSTRGDVEKIAKFVESSGNSVTYKTDNEILDVEYSDAKCIGHGWDIPRGRVVAYIVYPKNDFMLEDVLKAHKKLVKTGSDTGTTYYTDEADGIEFAVRLGSPDKIYDIRFTATAADSSVRCNGFSPYNPVADNYLHYDAGSIKNASTWDVGDIFSTLGQIKDQPNEKGYIFVYCKKGMMAECRRAKKKIETFSQFVLKHDVNRLVISLGGYKNHTEYETFLIPNDYPAAVPRPIYPSN